MQSEFWWGKLEEDW